MKAPYQGNPDGLPIYPDEMDHGYESPISGDTSVMKNLVKSLRHEQGLKMASRLARTWTGVSRSASRVASSQVTSEVARGLAVSLKSKPVSEGSMGWRLEPSEGASFTEVRFDKELMRVCAKNACLVMDKKVTGRRREILISGAEEIGITLTVSGGYVNLSSVEIYDN